MDRKKVVFAEMLYPEGHVVLNQKYIEILASISELTIIDNGDYFSKMTIPDNVRIINMRPWFPSIKRFLKIKKWIPFIKYDPISFIAHIYNLIIISINLIGFKYDKIIFSSARNDALCLSLPFFKKNSVVVFHHYDIDHLFSHPREMKIFKKNMNKYYHIVLADFIKEGLQNELPINPERVFVVYQPLIDNIDEQEALHKQRKPIVIGLGQTIDNKILQELIEYDKTHEERLPYNIILRHKSVEYNGNNIQIISNYLSREEFNNYLSESSACVLFYPESYKLRYSGILDDALSHGLPVYGNDIAVVRYFSNKYPNSCHVLTVPTDLFHLISLSINSMSVDDFKLFKEQHSDNNIRSMLNNVISK